MSPSATGFGIKDWLLRVEGKLDTVILNGCSKAPQHADHETRIRILERQAAVTSGKAIAAGFIAGAVITLVAPYLGRLF